MTNANAVAANRSALTKTFSRVAECALLMPPRRFFILGADEHHDLAVLGTSPVAVSAPTVVRLRGGSQCDLEAVFDAHRRFQEAIRAPQLASFTLRPSEVAALRRVIRRNAATHLRLFAYGGDTVTAHTFDYRNCFGSARLGRKTPTMRVISHALSSQCDQPFSVTLKASSLRQLPDADLSIAVRLGGLVVCEWIGDDYRFFLRDQEIVEPIAVFDSPAAGTSVALVLNQGG